MLLTTGIDPGDAYVSAVLPTVVLFGLGLTLVVTPVTSTVRPPPTPGTPASPQAPTTRCLASAACRRWPSCPPSPGLGGDRFYDPVTMAEGFRVAMAVCATLAAAGGVLAWFTIRDDVLVRKASEVDVHYSCDVAGPPLRTR